MRADAVAPDRQRPRRGDLGVELAERARGRVARVGERGLAGRRARLVQLGERRARQVDLAAHLDQLGRVVDPQRDRLDRPQVLGHVLADHPVAAGRPASEDAVLVGERDRQPVDLRLGDEAQLAGLDVELSQAVVQAGLPGAELLGAAGVAQREHRLGVAHLLELVQRLGPRPAGSASRGCAARGAPPRARAARRAARRRRRRRSRGRRGRSSGGRGGRSRAAAPPPASPGSLALTCLGRARQRVAEHPRPGPTRAAGRGPRGR